MLEFRSSSRVLSIGSSRLQPLLLLLICTTVVCHFLSLPLRHVFQLKPPSYFVYRTNSSRIVQSFPNNLHGSNTDSDSLTSWIPDRTSVRPTSSGFNASKAFYSPFDLSQFDGFAGISCTSSRS